MALDVPSEGEGWECTEMMQNRKLSPVTPLLQPCRELFLPLDLFPVHGAWTASLVVSELGSGQYVSLSEGRSFTQCLVLGKLWAP